MRPEEKLKVALVYPPFGPAGLPSLGLSLLSASTKRAGASCYTYYWNLHFLNKLPGANQAARMHAYWWLTGRAWHPFSEWIFSRVLYGEALDHQEWVTLQALQDRGALSQLPNNIGWRDLMQLRDLAADLIAEAVEAVDAYDVVGIATTFFQNLPALALAKGLKARRPDRPIVLGGANCDGDMGPALFRRFPFIDYVFIGEADNSFPEFIQRIAGGRQVLDVPGIISRDQQSVVFGPPASPLNNLDDLPLPDFQDFVEQRERLGLSQCQSLTLALESSRGCWWGAKQHCVFCGLNANGMASRMKSDERFRWEVREIVQHYDAKYIFMTDNIMPVEYYDGFLNWARTAKLGAKFFYEIKSNVKRSQVARMAEAGLTAVQPGIESFSSSLLTLMRKGVSAAQNVAFLKYAREHGIRSSYNLLVGFPGADPAEYLRMQEQLPKLFHLRPPSSVVPIEYHRFSPYHQRPADFGLTLHPAEEYQHLYPFPEEELSQIAYGFQSTDGELDASILRELSESVQYWQSVYQADDCTLTWRERVDDILIDDRRPRFGPARVSLQRYARAIFRLLDEPRSRTGLMRAAQNDQNESDTRVLLTWLFEQQREPGVRIIRFERSEFLEDPDACLKLLVDAGLLFEDRWIPPPVDLVTIPATPADPRYIALPVRASYQPEDTSWNSVGV